MLPPEVAECERKLREADGRLNALIMQIGQTFVDRNTEDTVKDTEYAPFFEQLRRIRLEKDSLEKRKLAVQGLRKCEKCSNILTLDSAFCNKCGEKLAEPVTEVPAGMHICPKCGMEYEEGSLFCPGCGNPIPQETVTDSRTAPYPEAAADDNKEPGADIKANEEGR